MKIGPRQRWIVLIGMLTATLTAAAWVRDSDRSGEQEIVEPPARVAAAQTQAARGGDAASRDNASRQNVSRNSRAPAAGGPDVLNLDKLRNRDDGANSVDPFAPKSWRRPAVVGKPTVQAPVAMAPPPPPSAPPLPFAYLGKLMSEETRTVYLTRGERNLVVQEGELIGPDYRFDRIAETRLTFTHLPSGLQQHLSIGESQ